MSPTTVPALSVASPSPFTFATGGTVTGSAYVLTGFDGASIFSGSNKQGSFVAVYDPGSRFVAAKLDKYTPGDPYDVACREAAADYNAAGSVATSDGFAFNAALGALAANGCQAKIILEVPPNPVRPGDPYRSFQPVAASN